MDKYVIDTSVIAKLFIEDEEDRQIAIDIFLKAHQKKILLFAPTLMLYELSNVLVKEQLSIVEIQSHLLTVKEQIDLGILQIISPDFDGLEQASKLAVTDTEGQGYISLYDATFHSLAISKNAVFVTGDKRHYLKTKKRFGSVILLENFKVPS